MDCFELKIKTLEKLFVFFDEFFNWLDFPLCIYFDLIYCLILFYRFKFLKSHFLFKFLSFLFFT